MKTIIDKFGRVVIPKSIRDDLGLKPGTEMDIQETPDHKVLIEPSREKPLLVREGTVLVYTAKMEPGAGGKDVANALDRQREERDRQNWGLR